MTDAEIVRTLAEKVLGWKYYWQHTAVKLRPPDSWLAENGRECVNFIVILVVIAFMRAGKHRVQIVLVILNIAAAGAGLSAIRTGVGRRRRG